MNNEINPIEEDFNAALSRYKAGQDLIPIVQDFQKIIQQIPNHFAAWTCLSWLQFCKSQCLSTLWMWKLLCSLINNE